MFSRFPYMALPSSLFLRMILSNHRSSNKCNIVQYYLVSRYKIASIKIIHLSSFICMQVGHQKVLLQRNCTLEVNKEDISICFPFTLLTVFPFKLSVDKVIGFWPHFYIMSMSWVQTTRPTSSDMISIHRLCLLFWFEGLALTLCVFTPSRFLHFRKYN